MKARVTSLIRSALVHASAAGQADTAPSHATPAASVPSISAAPKLVALDFTLRRIARSTGRTPPPSDATAAFDHSERASNEDGSSGKPSECRNSEYPPTRKTPIATIASA